TSTRRSCRRILHWPMATCACRTRRSPFRRSRRDSPQYLIRPSSSRDSRSSNAAEEDFAVTRNTITTVLLAAVAVAPLVAQQAPITHTPWKARDLTFSQATVVAAIEGAQLSGEPSRLAWTPDGNLLYVQTIDGPFG